MSSIPSLSCSATEKEPTQPEKSHTPFRVVVATLFPSSFPGLLGESIMGRALEAGLWTLRVVDLRRFGDRHGRVDAPPYGGGAGMVIRAEVIYQALATLSAEEQALSRRVLTSARGERFTQATARNWAQGEGVVLVCGRYEGVDERSLDACRLEQVSLGDFVLAGGEVAAMAMLEASLRHRAGVLGNPESLKIESFVDNRLEFPHYAKPREWRGRSVPSVLLSGDHAAIERWRQKHRILAPSSPLGQTPKPNPRTRLKSPTQEPNLRTQTQHLD